MKQLLAVLLMALSFDALAQTCVPVRYGGTGLCITSNTYTIGDLLYASGTQTISKLSGVATGSVLISGGIGVAPAWSSTPTFTATNVTGLPVSTGIIGLGTGVATALAVNVGTAGSFVVNGGALGTPSSGVATNLTGTAASLTAGLATDTVSKTGTGSTYATSASPTFTGTVSAAAITASGLTTTNGIYSATTNAGGYASNTFGELSATGIARVVIENGINNFGFFVGGASQSIRTGSAGGTGAIAELLSSNATYFSIGTYTAAPFYLTYGNVAKGGLGSATDFRLLNTVGLGFTTAVGTATRTTISEVSSGVLGISTGAVGGTTGSLIAANLQTGGSALLTLTAGAFGMAKMTASGTAPGATGLKIEAVCGTNAGSMKLVAAAGTSGTAVTIIDNIGSGATGC